MSKPSVKDITWRLIYSKNGVEVYSDKENPWIDFRVKLNGRYIKRFYGESAYSNVERYVHDIAMEFYDFDVNSIYDEIVAATMKELKARDLARF